MKCFKILLKKIILKELREKTKRRKIKEVISIIIMIKIIKKISTKTNVSQNSIDWMKKTEGYFPRFKELECENKIALWK